jgi:UDP-N-acetylmuramoylalanine--D-glutamate ligase
MDVRGRRATIMGLGHFGGGLGAAQWLARQGAIVTVTDLADERALADALPALAGVPIAAMHLGGHRDEDFRDAELVVVNPAVRPGNPFVEMARRSGVPITTEIELFLRACPAQIIGVTGSNGKSTTAAMIAAILRAEGRPTWLGGNIGESLLGKLDCIGAGDWVVLELSSFQLWYLNPDTPAPHVAVLTNCTPNHLDWHGSFAEYMAAKQRILTSQHCNDIAVLNPMDSIVSSWDHLARGRLANFYPEAGVPRLRLPGSHWRIDAALAASAARGLGCRDETIQEALRRFAGLPQRMELVAMIDGRRMTNDSASTTPESTIAALESLEKPLWLLAGGKDKGTDFGPLCEAIVRRATGAALFGSVRNVLRERIFALQPGFPAVAVETLSEAYAWTWERSAPGDTILLSPACASTDQFRNYRHRGEFFLELIRALVGQKGRGEEGEKGETETGGQSDEEL